MIRSPTSVRWMATAVRAALADALALVLPVRCAGCDEPTCRCATRAASVLRPRRDAEQSTLEVWSGATFDGCPGARRARARRRTAAPGSRATSLPACGRPSMPRSVRRRRRLQRRRPGAVSGDRAGPDVAGGVPPTRLPRRRAGRPTGGTAAPSAAVGGAGDRRPARPRPRRPRAQRGALAARAGCRGSSRAADRRRRHDRRDARRGGARAAGRRRGGHRGRHDRRHRAPSRSSES